ncbi:MAG: alpha/beta hydrolase [Leptospiraceae bacterium]|nr:alpha/beta hydrolase [Leptospiraceae bacterium]
MQKRNATILYFHGNSQNITSHFLALGWLLIDGYEIIAFDYPGYGASSGSPTDELVYTTSLFVLNEVHHQLKMQNHSMIVFAQSLGSAIALYAIPDMTDKSNLKGVIVEGSFASYSDIALEKADGFCLPPFTYLAKALIRDTYSPANRIASISPIPLLVIHGERDSIIPLSFGRAVYQLAAEPKKFMLIKNGRHLNWIYPGQAQYRNALKNELDQMLGNAAVK